MRTHVIGDKIRVNHAIQNQNPCSTSMTERKISLCSVKTHHADLHTKRLYIWSADKDAQWETAGHSIVGHIDCLGDL